MITEYRAYIINIYASLRLCMIRILAFKSYRIWVNLFPDCSKKKFGVIYFQGHSPTTLSAKDHRHDKKHKDRHKHKTAAAAADHDTHASQHPFHNKAIAVAPPMVPNVPPPSNPPPPGPSLVADPHTAELVAERLQQHQVSRSLFWCNRTALLYIMLRI